MCIRPDSVIEFMCILFQPKDPMEMNGRGVWPLAHPHSVLFLSLFLSVDKKKKTEE